MSKGEVVVGKGVLVGKGEIVVGEEGGASSK